MIASASMQSHNCFGNQFGCNTSWAKYLFCIAENRLVEFERIFRVNRLDGLSWYLAQLKPNAYRIALRNLERQGFQTFLPMHDASIRKRGTFVLEAKPLFPGYVFVGLGTQQTRLDLINNTYGVSSLVKFGQNPAQVPAGLVDELKGRCDDHGKLLPQRDFEPGSLVKATSGPFANFVATVETADDAQRVWVLLDFLGTATRVSMKTGNLKSA